MDEELQTMKQQTATGVRFGFELYRILQMKKQQEQKGRPINKEELQKIMQDNDFAFTGERTDLGYFYNKKLLPLEEIEKLSEELKENCLKVLQEAGQDGNVAYIKDLKAWELTEQGYDLLRNQQFRDNVIAEQKRVIQEILTKDGEIEKINALDGRMSDMGVFLTNDKVNILDFEGTEHNINKVMQNFNLCESRGLVTIYENGDIIPTEQGYKFIKSNTFKEKCAEQAIAKTTIKQNGKVIVGKENSLSALVKDGQEKLAKKTGKEVAKQTANTVADGALATAPTGVTQGVVIAKKIIEVGAKTLNVGKSLSRTRE